MAKDLMPTSDLEDPRNLDVPALLLPRLSLFAGLKPAPSLDKYPGSVVVRRYPRGDAMCRQAEPGWTAFYILTAQDLNELREHPRSRLEAIPQEMQNAEASLDASRQQLADLAARRQDVNVPDVDKKDLPKKLDSLIKEQAKLEKAVGDLREEQATWQGYLPTAAASFPGTGQPRTGERGLTPEERPVMAEAYLTKATSAPTQRRGLFDRLQGWFGGRSANVGARVRRRARFDGPADFADERRINVMFAGDLFGEKSCLQRTPRSATVVAARACYVLVFLRNIMDMLLRDKSHEQKTLELLRTRSLKTWFLDFPIFRGLTDKQLDDLCQQVVMERKEPGALIYDENDPSDCLHLIGGGFVKIMHNVSWLLKSDDVADWPALQADLAAAAAPTAGLVHQLWQQLPAPVQTQLASGAALSDQERQQVVFGLNELLKEPGLHARPEFAKLIVERGLANKIWSLLAAPECSSAAGLEQCNRRMVDALCPGLMLPGLLGGRQAHARLGANDIKDWKKFADQFVADKKSATDPGRPIWGLVPTAAQEKFRAAQTTPVPPEAAEELLAALNALISGAPLLLNPAIAKYLGDKDQVAKKFQEFLPHRECWTEFAFDRTTRAFNRLVLDALWPQSLGKSRRPSGPAVVVAYRGRGEYIGEIGLVENKPRSATCVAYNHPDNDPQRNPGPVYLVRLSRALFDTLLAQSPGMRESVAEVMVQRKAASQAAQQTPAGLPGTIADEAAQLGLMEGQQLMLIDLDRCTRCDECVKACVATHDDGRSRLFLSGPRFDHHPKKEDSLHHYLVPTTCRACLDPVCMIGCPVGSIHRGAHGEMLIEDWCIGCTLCANQCPYGAIQMHQLGPVPESSFGWRYLPARLVTDPTWTQAGYDDRTWRVDRAPFRFDRVFQEAFGHGLAPPDQPIDFRFRFMVDKQALASSPAFALEVIATEAAIASAKVWLNGQEVATTERPKRGRREYPHIQVRPGANSLAVQITPGVLSAAPFFDVSLYEIRQLKEDVTEKVVTQRAVVCDLCASLPGGPACVRACPHEAALRVNGQALVAT